MKFTISTKGHNDIIDITPQVQAAATESGIKNGAVLVFIPGSTAAITATEFEEGVVTDLQKVLEQIAPEDHDYEHHKRWNDHNGAAHIKSALVGTDFTLPLEAGKLALGTWQQIILIDFDEKPRSREVVVHVIGN